MSGKHVPVWAIVAAIAVGAAISTSAAQETKTFRLRLATIVPDNSPWTAALRAMDAMLKKATDNRVGVQVFPSAEQGEKDLLARMELKGFDAATLGLPGLANIDLSVNVFGIPFFFDSDDEYQHVRKALTPTIRKRFEARGYHLVNWGHGGWVRLFSKQPLRTVAAIKAARLGTGDQRGLRWYERNGFHPVFVQTSQIVTALRAPAGPIDATVFAPVYAAPTGLYAAAPNMLDVPMGPLTAATVIHAVAWARISDADRVKLLGVGGVTEAAINAAAPGLDRRYIEEMKKAGLQIITVNVPNLPTFKAEAARLALTQRDDLVPADVYDEAVKARDEFRRLKK